VFCVKFQRELLGLDEPPFDNELGQRIYEQVSRDAWALWMEHCKMILNEYETAPIHRRVGGRYYPSQPFFKTPWKEPITWQS
jgi:Fe-S cluster biosynthesis and repair protein YggX